MRFAILFLTILLTITSQRNLNLQQNQTHRSQSLLCKVCLATIGVMRSSHKIVPTTMIKKILKAACMRKIRNPNLCGHISEQLTPIFLETFWNRVFNPKIVCGSLNVCHKYFKKLDVRSEIQRILNINKTRANYQQLQTSNTTMKILHISDIHMDLEYAPGYNAVCDDIICCHKENGINTNPADNAGQYGDYRCDPPITLLQQTIEHIKDNHKDIKLVIVSGDMSAHNQWTKSMASNNLINKKIIEKLGQLNAEIVFGFGNNECYPDHQFDSEGEIPLKEGIVQAMNKYLNPIEWNSIIENGYYARVLEDYRLKVISLNTIVCDNSNFYLIGNVTDPNNQLRWLEKELLKSESNAESVYIVGHIPPSLLQCSTIWSDIYRALINRFNQTIKGQFFGHTHQDQFVVYNHSETADPTSILFQTSSFTPIGKQQPSYRIYEVDSVVKNVLNYYQYSLDLKTANQKGQLRWYNTYNFLEEYQVKDMSADSIAKLRALFLTDSSLFDKYTFHLAGDIVKQNLSTRSQYCQTYDNHKAIYDCNNITEKSDKLNYFLELLQGPWMVPI